MRRALSDCAVPRYDLSKELASGAAISHFARSLTRLYRFGAFETLFFEQPYERRRLGRPPPCWQTSSDTASMKVNLIASSELFFELNWIRELLAEMDVTIFISPKMELFLDNSIYVLSANHNPLRQMSAHFWTNLKDVSSKGLIHISDEFFIGPYELYQEFDFVIRQYHSKYFTCPGILTVPLGYTNELKETNEVLVARSRPYVWTFAGNLTTARKEMLKQFQSIQPNL